MTKIGWALGFAATIGLGGCYEFESPLDATPQIPRDEALVGQWRCLYAKPSPTAEARTIGISQEGDRGYAFTPERDGKQPEHLSGYASVVSGSTILNLRNSDQDSTTKKWTLVRYSFLLPDVVRFQLVNDESFRDFQSSSAVLRTALERRALQPGVYEDLFICVRSLGEL